MNKKTSWENSHDWYHKTVGETGHFYHKTVVLPGLLRLLQLQKGDSLLDLACGQGVVARTIPPFVSYTGVDLSPSLIQAAKKEKSSLTTPPVFLTGTITEPLPLPPHSFSHACIILALQNIEQPDKALRTASTYLKPGGKLVLVLNHPCFRIPRQSSWGVDEQKKLQYRRVDRYLSPLKIPIDTHPSQKKESVQTWSFHHSLSDYSRFLQQSSFGIELLEEWVSPKESTGPKARMENRAREEFPLFLALLAKKIA